MYNRYHDNHLQQLLHKDSMLNWLSMAHLGKDRQLCDAVRWRLGLAHT